MQHSFQNKVAVITGGSSGIGKALTLALLNAGAHVAICGRNQASLDALKSSLTTTPQKQTPNSNPTPNPTTTNLTSHLFTHVADVSSESDCQSFISAALNHFGKIDILINNAGLTMRALFKDADLSVLKTLMDINFWGTVYCTKYALPSILANKGTIVGISSIAGYRGLPGRTGYSASKFAMQGFLEALRTENLHTGVNVMWISPGFTASNIRNTALDQSGHAQGETPLDEGRLMTSEAVAQATLKAIAKRKRTLVLTSQGKLTVLLSRLLPGVLDGLVYNHFKKEPGSPLQ